MATFGVSASPPRNTMEKQCDLRRCSAGSPQYPGLQVRARPISVIEEVIALAIRAPSSMNTQPWHLHVLTGEPLDRIRRRG